MAIINPKYDPLELGGDAPATVRGTVLTGLSTATATPVTAADTVLVAAGKLQRQATDNAANSRLRFILTSTWALLPAANSVPTGTRYFVSDIGINGSDWYTDGVRWQLVNGRVTLAMSNAANTLSTSGTLATINIPAGVMGTSGVLEVSTLCSCVNNANAKSVAIRLGGLVALNISLASTLSNSALSVIRNRTASSQIMFSGSAVYGSFSALPSTLSIDTTVAQTVTITATISTGGDTITLESYRIDLIA